MAVRDDAFAIGAQPHADCVQTNTTLQLSFY